MGQRIKKTREERIQEIHDAATDAFLEKGFKKTTMEEIIGRTSLSKGGFYHYYKNPREILLDIMAKKNVLFIEGTMEVKGDETLEELADLFTRSSVTKVLGDRREKPLYLMFLMEMLNDPSLEKIFNDFEQETLKMIGDRLGWNQSDEAHMANMFMSRVINGLLIADIIFSKDKIMRSQPDRMYQLLYPMMLEILKNP